MIRQNFQGIFTHDIFWGGCQKLNENIWQLLEELKLQKLLLS
jgi:hypothetical protein